MSPTRRSSRKPSKASRPEGVIATEPSGASHGAPDDHADELVALTRALVDISSPTGAERACARYLRDWFRTRGIEAELHDLEPERANVVARLPGRRRGPSLLLAGHLDTSYAGDAALDYPGLGAAGPNARPVSYLVGDGVYGLGAFNMKGGLAASAVAFAELAAGPGLDGDVLFAGLAGESEKAQVANAARPRLGRAFEGRGFGARRFIAAGGQADVAVVAGPSALRVVNAQAGSLFIELVACGRPAYLGRRTVDEAGAIETIAALVPELAAWGADYTARHRLDTGLGTLDPGLTIGAVDGGWSFAPSTTPAVCHLYLDLRTAPGQSQAEAVRELRVLLSAVEARSPGVTIRGGVYARGRGTQTPADHVLVRTAVDVLERELGLAAAPFPPGSGDTSNDTNVFRMRGIPSIKVGPSDRLDPDPDATARHGIHVSCGDLVAAARLYERLARRLTSTSAAIAGGRPT
jgi:acetylornithine deacetylase/succinyl-diaminopimelate desuccinylase-like protein